MKRRSRLIFVPLLVILGLIFATSIAGAAPPVQVGPPAGVGPATHIVVFHDWVDPEVTSAELARAHGLSREFVYRYALKGASLVIPPGREAAVRSDPRVASIEPNQVATVFAENLPTGVDRIDAEGAGGSSVVDVDIAIIDTGVDFAHPDLNVVGRTDCARGSFFSSKCSDGSGTDGSGHGTHVAGIAAARDNDIGVRGVAPGARLWAVRVLGNDGSGYYSWIIAGVDWVTARAATIEVANMSIGGPPSSALDTAISRSVGAGITYVVAAGNDGADASNYSPSSNSDAITVSAIVDTDGKGGKLGGSTSYGDDDTFASFSNYGSPVDLAAPGVNILSTYPGGGYRTMSGTSMASPHVAGAAALYMADHPGALPADVKEYLIETGKAQGDQTYGFTGDRDGIPEPLVYVGLGSVTPSPNTPPTVPGSPSPANNATGVAVTTTLSWTGGDPDSGDSVTYTVRLDANSSIPTTVVVVCTGLSTTSCNPTGDFVADTDYSWQVVATDSHGASTSGPVWHFRTAAVSSPSVLTVTSVDPSRVKGGFGYTLTVRGTGFAEGARASFENGLDTAPEVSNTQFVNSTTLEVTITTSVTSKPRRWDLRVTNPNEGGTAVLPGALTTTK